MIKTNPKYTRWAQELGMEIDSNTGCVFGLMDGYHLSLLPIAGTAQYTLSVSVKRMGLEPSKANFKPLVKGSRAIASCGVKKNKVTFGIKQGMTESKRTENLKAAVADAVNFLRANQYENCCESCGRSDGLSQYYVGGAAMTLCSACYEKRAAEIEITQQTKQRKPENMLLGTVGALVGSVLGAAIILLIAQLGYVSVWGGILMGMLTIKGYELLGGQLSTKGIVISAVFMLGMVYLANRIDWTILILNYYDVSFATAFQGVTELLREGYIESGTYYWNLILSYLFTIGGAVIAIIGALKNKKTMATVYKLGETPPQQMTGFES